MTVYTLQAGMPQIVVDSGVYLRLEAISPTTGAAITGVTATAWAIYGDDLTDTTATEEIGDLGSWVMVPGAPEFA